METLGAEYCGLAGSEKSIRPVYRMSASSGVYTRAVVSLAGISIGPAVAVGVGKGGAS
jgi:hypothetical protein